ncbi:MCE family protein [Mycolicibacterium holsaticum]|uniref:Mammalian cell entry protein n=1 Tax=Mycolicibacterium holsaticum TaxID=152142 RepID=A0A1E3S1F8_9MYCO|nr:MCE family protein [Mycolicibacterium holsaticum]ODQ95959.1 mammalian cell entry protein [Mycolicibacterium holsaticum]
MISGIKRLTVVGSCVAMALTGCSFQGINSLPLPGAVGRGADAVTYHVQVANVATLESNSPVMIDDVVVGSVGKMTVDNWHADVEISVKPDVAIPANAVATVGQTSLLGSMHLALNPPLGEEPSGRLQPGATIPLSESSTYPSTERTLSSLSMVVNGGGLGQIGDVIHNFSAAVSGREPEIRELLTRLDNFIGVLDTQRDDIIATIQQLNRVAGTFAGQREVIDRALKEIPPAIDVLIKERPNLTTALEKLGTFGDTATTLVNEAGDDLVKDLENLGPALGAIADIGPDLNLALLWATAFPYGPTFADRITRGDYINLFATFDLTYPRLKKTLLLGTRWGDENAKLIPAPGDPYWATYSYNPMSLGVAPPPTEGLAPSAGAPPGETTPKVNGPLLPVVPPPPAAPWLPSAPVTTSSQIFAGPYGAEAPAQAELPAPPAQAELPAPPAQAELPAPPAQAELPAPPAGGGG